MKTYLLVAAAMLTTLVAVPTPASALACFPPDAPDVSDELRCQTQNLIRCDGDLAWACAIVNNALDTAVDAVEAVENLVHDAPSKFHPEVTIYLP